MQVAHVRLPSASPLRLLAFLLWVGSLSIAPPASAAPDFDPSRPDFWYGRAADGTPTIRVHFFWTSRCEHCRAARPFMEALPERLPYVELSSRPTDGNAGNARQQAAIARALGADPTSVPAIFFCGQAQIGYDNAAGVGAAIVQRLADCRARLAADPGLLTRPVPVVARAGSSSGGLGAGGVVAVVVGLAFVALVVAGVVLSRRAAAAKRREIAARHAERTPKKKR